MFLLSTFKFLCHSWFIAESTGTSFPQARNYVCVVDYFLYFCGFYLFCMTTTWLIWKVFRYSVKILTYQCFPIFWANFKLVIRLYCLYNKYFVLLLDFTCDYQVQSTSRRGIKLCFVGIKRILLHVAVKISWVQLDKCLSNVQVSTVYVALGCDL